MTCPVGISDLQLLEAIDRLGSLAAVARELQITQPAVSARVASLEERTSLTLVARTTQGSSLTVDGQALLKTGRPILIAAEVLESELASLQHRREATLVVAASLTVAEHLMPSWLEIFERHHPHVHVGLEVVNSASVEQRIAERLADIGFTETSRPPPDLSGRIIGHDYLVVVVRPGHPWANQPGIVDKVELAHTPLLLREFGSGTRDSFEIALGTSPTTHMEIGSTAALVAAARTGTAPAVVSRLAVTEQIRRGDLIIVPTQLDLRRPLRALWRGRRPPGAAAKMLECVGAIGTGDQQPQSSG
jgi:molybdate transport repressor ModE-like protein